MNSRYRYERRQPPYYLITGLVLGLALGLLISFVLLPVRYTNVPPETLSGGGKDQYRLMIASAFEADGNLNRAEARLGLLREEDIKASLENQITRSESKADAQVLQGLMNALKAPSVPVVISTQSLLTPTPTLTPTTFISPTPLETNTDDQAVRTATPEAEATRVVRTPVMTATPNTLGSIPFILSEERTVCNAALNESLIQIEVFDANGKAMPNVEILVSWDGGSSSFFTGYYPEVSKGYADFTMEPGVSYVTRVGAIGELVSDLIPPECEDDGLPFWGSIYLRFDEP